MGLKKEIKKFIKNIRKLIRGNKMKLYKFRSLGTETDLERLKTIIETGHFWCSRFFDLNDPMEGVFSALGLPEKLIDKIFDGKKRYKICSFSGKNGLKNPTLWGYYANGFKGVAIEVEVKVNERIKPVRYISSIHSEDYRTNTRDVKEILTRKLKSWEHEDEFRFLVDSGNNLHYIGKITKVYFGNPYGDLINTTDVLENSEKLRKYNELKDKLKEICQDKGIDTTDINIMG